MAESSKCKFKGCKESCHIGKEYCLEHYKEVGDYSYGLDADLKKKMAAKLDPDKMAECQEWIESVVGEKFPSDFQESLKSGVTLCKLLNKIKSGTVENINKSKMPFSQRENIENYLKGCKALGMKETDLFVTQNLFEGDNMVVVIDNIYALGALAKKYDGFKGPHIGIKFADQNVRNFSDEQLNQYVPSKQTQGSYGYQPKHEDKLDKIIKAPIIKASDQFQVEQEKPNPKAAAKKADSPKKDAGGKFCAGCGAKRDGAGKFCASCGAQF